MNEGLVVIEISMFTKILVKKKEISLKILLIPVQLKEILHKIIMATFLFEIITLYSLIAGLMPIRKRTIETYFEKPKLSKI